MRMNDVIVLANTSDSFEDSWHPFFKLFKSYWPDGALALEVTPQALADKMQLLIDHPELAVCWGQAGFTKLSSLFTKVSWLSQIESVYGTILPS